MRRWRASEWLVPLLVVLDAVAVLAAMALAWALRFRWELGALESVPVAPFAEYLKAAALLCVLVPLLLRWRGVYRTQKLFSGVEETWSIFAAVLLATGLVLVLAFFHKPPHEAFRYSRLTFGYFVALATVLLGLNHAVVHAIRLGRYRRGLDLRRALVVGEPTSYLVERLVSEPAFGLEVTGWVAPRGRTEQPPPAPAPSQPAPPAEPAAGGTDSGAVGVLVSSARTRTRPAGVETVRALPRLGTLAELDRLLAAHRIEELLIIDHGLRHRELLRAIDAAERHGAVVHLVPPTYDLLVRPGDLVQVQGVPIIRIDERRYRRWGFLCKRAFDLVVASAALVVLSPLMALIALLIKRDSPGPVLFAQLRAGEGGRPFRMLKFRTMVADAEQRLEAVVDLERLAEPVFKLADDPRVTRVGRWLRRTSLDELPQLWNVLKGEMSLVGPRPEELRLVERYDEWQRRRLKVRPGMTGLQQVTARGALASLGERVRLDVYYIRNQSLLLDLWILVRTVWAVVRGRGAS
ncbi:MAG: hypothetical protein KatS3mg102_0828 [Planctomycetota bacterium]|nr:MAG: hypothetical protein KatS3mg102_0828 [Planctomycetota bacterium]